MLPILRLLVGLPSNMSDIRNLTVLPRPRSAWQAMDAGFTLARAHYVQLVLMWLGFSLPIFIACMAVQLWLGWAYTLIVWWWFKPLYELPILFYLSKALFSEECTVTQAWKITLTHFWRLFRSYLTVARLSTSRALSYSVVFLEMLPRKKRANRIQTLCAVQTRHYLLMLACLHIEYILTYAIIAFVALVFFSSSIAEIQLNVLLQTIADPALKMWVLAASITTLISAALVAPFYVAGGFLIYINRRMHLEAWDIEHRFRSIKPRITKNTVLTSLLLVGLMLGNNKPAVAAERAESIMSSSAAASAIAEIMAGEEFGSTKSRTVPTLKKREKEDKEEDKLDLGFFEWFANAAGSFATLFKVLLWTTVAIFIGLLLYTLSRFRRNFSTPSALTRHRSDGEDAQSHPMTQDLPVDIAAKAEQLLANGQRRQALSVLFRGALRSVMNEHELRIASGATETDCQNSVAAVANQIQTQTFSNLLGVWRKEAYASQPQSEESIRLLINDWKSAFDLTSQPNDGTAIT